MTTDNLSVVTFGESSPVLHQQGWRPIPLATGTKQPCLPGWSRFNKQSHDLAELSHISSYYYDAAVGVAIPSENLALDNDIMDQDRANEVTTIADQIFGKTPLIRIGLSPKSVRLYRCDGTVRGIKPHPIELFSGSGQVAVYGFHQKAGRPYLWPKAQPTEIAADSKELPIVTDQLVRTFLNTIESILVDMRKKRRKFGGSGIGLDSSNQLNTLLKRGINFRTAAKMVLSGACEGGRHYAVRAVVGSGFNRGMNVDQIHLLVKRAAPAELLELVINDGYLDRVLNDFAPQQNNYWITE